MWLAFWTDGGVLYFKDGVVRASFTTANGLGKGHVAGIRLDQDGLCGRQQRRAGSAASKMAVSPLSQRTMVYRVTRSTGPLKTTIIPSG